MPSSDTPRLFSSDSSQALEPGGRLSSPGVILTTSGAAADVAAHASELSGSPLLPVTAPLDAILDRAHANQTALIVADQTVIRALEFPWFLQTLTAHGIRFGIQFVTDAVQGRAMSRKLLQADPLPIRGDAFIVVDTDDRPGMDSLAPVVRSSLPADLATQGVDLIVFSGHSGPLDARAGTHEVLCARADANGYRGPGVFACYHDGICFRAHGRLPTIAPSSINAQVAVLAGCGTASPGRSIFSAEYNLVQVLLQGPPLAVIASCGVTFKVPELDLLCVSWIMGGVPLGEVVRRLNAISNKELGQNGALPPNVGPLMLFGNPCLRFDSSTAREAESQPEVPLPISVTLPGTSSHHSIRVPEAYEPPLRVDVDGAATCRFFVDEERHLLHVWKAEGSSIDVRVDEADDHPYGAYRTAVQRAARNVPLWLPYLASCVPSARSAGQTGEEFYKMLSELPAWATWAGFAYKRLTPRACIPVSHRDANALIERDIHPKLKRWNTSLGQCALRAVAGHRSLPMEKWSERFLSIGAPFRERVCTCGEADRWGQRFKDVGSDLERALYQCTHCGPVGESDGVVQLSFERLSAPERAGDPIEIVCRVTAGEDEHLYAALSVVLDRYGVHDSIPSDFIVLDLAPGQSRRIDTTIPVPADVSPGVYLIWMPAVLNGVLCVESQLLELPPR